MYLFLTATNGPHHPHQKQTKGGASCYWGNHCTIGIFPGFLLVNVFTLTRNL